MIHAVVAQTAFLVGLTPLIPLPFVDEFVRIRLLKRSFRRVGAALGVDLSPAVLRALSEDRQGMVAGCAVALIWWPIKKLFKTILYFLTIKESLDWICEGALRAEMVHHACLNGVLPDHPDRVRQTMLRVLKGHHYSPVNRLLLLRKRPEMAQRQGPWYVKLVYRLVQAGGGAVLLDAFDRRLREAMDAGSGGLEE